MSGRKYVEDACHKLNAEQGVVAPSSWFRVDVPRAGSAKQADPYWFSPDGFRFRSIKEVDRWRETGWDRGGLPKTAFQEKKTDGLGISREEALSKGVLTREQLEQIKGAAAAARAPGVGRRGRGDGDGSDGGGAGSGSGFGRRRRIEDIVAGTVEGRLLLQQLQQGQCLRSVTTLAPKQASPVISVFQKKTLVGFLRGTHFIGVDMRRVLPESLHVYQRTVYDAVTEFGCKPYMQLLGQRGADEDGERAFQGAIMLMRCEALPLYLASSSSSSSAASLATAAAASSAASSSAATPAADADDAGAGAVGEDALSCFFRVLNSRNRVGFCQTVDNNMQCYVIPKAAYGPGDTTEAEVEKGRGVLDAPLQELVSQAQNAGDFPPGEDVLLVFVLRSLDGSTLLSTPGVGELPGPMQSDMAKPPPREPPIPAAPSFAAWCERNPGRCSPVERQAAAAFLLQQQQQQAAEAAAAAVAATAEAAAAAQAAAEGQSGAAGAAGAGAGEAAEAPMA